MERVKLLPRYGSDWPVPFSRIAPFGGVSHSGDLATGADPRGSECLGPIQFDLLTTYLALTQVEPP